MKALTFDGELKLNNAYPNPECRPDWAVIHVYMAGICRTDLELTQGYMGFNGVLGHEFVGKVEECEDLTWMGHRVVGEINAACGTCEWCRQWLGRHCPHRSTLGINKLDGCMAEYCTLPTDNLLRLPEEVSDVQATFIEPLSAAYEILEQIPVQAEDRCVVMGDGKLGILCAWVLSTVSEDVTLVGHHPEKLHRAQWGSLKTTDNIADIEPGADIVVEATGSTEGFTASMNLCRPRGVLVLKSTIAADNAINLAPIVINEISVIGSRCGQFKEGLAGLRTHNFPVESLVDARYPLSTAQEAFEHAAQKGALKILLEIDNYRYHKTLE